MRDLLIITPSRGRPGRLAGMIDACLSLAEKQTDIAVGIDYDDPCREAYEALRDRDRVCYFTGSRKTLAAWTNTIAREHLPPADPLLPAPVHPQFRAFASFGDDHMPRTPGWDRLLLDAIDGMGGTGFAYGDDLGQRENLATSVVVSADIVQALGWFMLPACAHYHVDNVWMDLGRGAGCLAWCPDVVIEHAHPFWGAAPMDATYESEFGRGDADLAAYETWRRDRMATDIPTVAAARKGS